MKLKILLFLIVLSSLGLQSCWRRPDRAKKKKPVIYLYPEKTTEVHVKLKLAEDHLIHSYPKYADAEGWTVIADPDGNLRDPKTQRNYYALFWESEGKAIQPTTGFIVIRC